MDAVAASTLVWTPCDFSSAIMASPALNLRRFTVTEYHAMAEAGVFGPEERIELLDGYLIPMAPFTAPHVIAVNRLSRLLTLAVEDAYGDAFTVSTQNNLRLEDWSEPEPDVVLLRTDYEREARVPEARDALLVVEVAVSTERFDREVKLPRYADAGIPEVWIVLPEKRRVEVYRQPERNRYAEMQTLGADGALSIEALPDLPPVALADVLR